MIDMLSHLGGPTGGLMAGAFAAGAVFGYGFSQKTVLSEARKRIANLEAHVERLEEKYDKLSEELMSEVRGTRA